MSERVPPKLTDEDRAAIAKQVTKELADVAFKEELRHARIAAGLPGDAPVNGSLYWRALYAAEQVAAELKRFNDREDERDATARIERDAQELAEQHEQYRFPTLGCSCASCTRRRRM